VGEEECREHHTGPEHEIATEDVGRAGCDELFDLREFRGREKRDCRGAGIFGSFAEFFELLVGDEFGARDADARDGPGARNFASAIGEKIEDLFGCEVAIGGTLKDDERRQEFLNFVDIGKADDGRGIGGTPKLRSENKAPYGADKSDCNEQPQSFGAAETRL
jgi:hypothetical protein